MVFLVSGFALPRVQKVHLGEARLTEGGTGRPGQRFLQRLQIVAAESATAPAQLVTAWPRWHRQLSSVMRASTGCQALLHFSLSQLLQALKQGNSARPIVLLPPRLPHPFPHPSLHLRLLLVA